MTHDRPTRLHRDDGLVAALTALFLVPLLVAVAFATDTGQWYAQGSRMQRAADAAALASAVWLDDRADANHWSNAALDVAARNGFANGRSLNGGTISVTPSRVPPNKVRVCITANAQILFGRVVRDRETLSRCSTAAYNLPVPLGSPRNYLGTGDLGRAAAGSGPYETENLWLAVSGPCTDKTQGDQHAARFTNGPTASNTCAGAGNAEYADDNDLFALDLPAGRAYATDVLVYNGNLDAAREATSGCAASPGQNRTNESCPGSNPSNWPLMSTDMKLYKADSTVFDDTDNPPMTTIDCSGGGAPATSTGEKVFAPTTGGADANTTFNPNPTQFVDTGSDGTVTGRAWWNLCRIPSSAPAGTYLLRVRNQATPVGGASVPTVGSNAFSLVANRVETPGLCDARTDATCPRVYARDSLSVYARAAGTADFYLAEVGGQHAGKTVQIDLWDAAEGATNLRLQYPTGCGTWGYQTFDWTATTGDRGRGVSNIPISSYSFNNQRITITFPLPTTWNPPVCNQWFRVEYTYSATATDRTTWSLRLLGDPVHLVN